MRKNSMALALALALALFAAWTAEAQSYDDIKEQGSVYLWGEGRGNTLKKADSEALSDLINQISVTVDSRFELLREEKKDADFKETFQSVIRTYSSATLNNTERLVVDNEPNAHVLRYMKRSEIDRIFAARKEKCLAFATSAIKAESSGQLADALRYYYWSQTLLRSLPDASNVYLDDNGEKRLLTVWLPLQINTLFSGMDVSIARVTENGEWKEVELAVTYRGEPARNFDYTYWDGRDWSNIVSAKDGRGVAELPKSVDASEIRLRGEYVFDGEASVDAELRDVLSNLDVVPYPKCYLTARPSGGNGNGRSVVAGGSAGSVGKGSVVAPPKAVGARADYDLFVPVADSSRYLGVVKRVEEAVRARRYDDVRDCFDATGFDMFTRLANYGRARVYGTPSYSVFKDGETVMCRSLPLSFSFSSNNRTFVEDVVFEFNKEGKIASLAFGLSQAALDDIAARTSWNAYSRLTIVRFLENYKTAYALKRLDYLESIFADDALIIVGSKVKKQPANDVRKLTIDKQVVQYVHKTKEQYLKSLRGVFASNEFVNLKFADNAIRKSGTRGEVYSIQIRQDYFSTNYGDTGYLFLMVDLNKPEEPVIHVRAWQEELDPDFGLIDMSHFSF